MKMPLRVRDGFFLQCPSFFHPDGRAGVNVSNIASVISSMLYNRRSCYPVLFAKTQRLTVAVRSVRRI